MTFTVIVPAHNEENYLGHCLSSLQQAKKQHQVDIIVVLNRCTDATESVALEHGARVVTEDQRNLSAIRNAGVRAATSEVIVTIDADSMVSDNLFDEIEQALASGNVVGGCVKVVPERYSAGILVTYALLNLMLLFTRLGGGMYWCYREDFWQAGGFDEKMDFGEDLDFARRLRRLGRLRGQHFQTLPRVTMTTSCRKFDRFGDWHMLTLPFTQARAIRQGLKGTSSSFQDYYFYDFERSEKVSSEESE